MISSPSTIGWNAWRVADQDLVSVFSSHRKGHTPAVLAFPLTQAWTDLVELQAGDDYVDGESLKPTARTFGHARQMIARTTRSYPEPEVSTMENGTILLLWRRALDFITLELGDTRFGLVVRSIGMPSVLLNGDIAELGIDLEDRLARQFGITRRLPVSAPLSNYAIAAPRPASDSSISSLTMA